MVIWGMVTLTTVVHIRPPNYFFEKIWEIWEFFSEKYGRNMGDFGIFMAKFGKNMGNMGDFQPFFPYFFHIFNHQNVKKQAT